MDFITYVMRFKLQ